MFCNKCKCYVLNFFFLFAGRVFSYLTKFLLLQKVVISPINTVDKLKGATGGGAFITPPPLKEKDLMDKMRKKLRQKMSL